jgi:hypothetical protein
MGLQLAKTVAKCEARLIHFGFAPNTVLVWIWWCLLVCRWLILPIQHLEHLKFRFADTPNANTAAECCIYK